ncbi:MAG TPA: glycosyltransferase [Candidatus Ligilactobacillus excrementigallinarum]|uniref:Glycosyltransferase n=1 Tax=Candidatus Ligilactobacillus excrementigallinarum TaxID=2838641 RepID=A0A9D1UXP3_9LACO|nr:glycosyltransferase [Candidatus Ligilactobacillus excrementigallinarum]
MTKVSVIVPVYNVEKYLDRCIKSLVNQEFDRDEYEIILIDDGSTDNSGEMCDKFQKKNANVKTFHIENSGVSFARNYGIKLSKGKYITFVDPDDYVSLQYISILYDLVNLNNVKMGACGSNTVYKNEIKIDKPQNDSENIRLSNTKMMENIFIKKNNIGLAVWGKIFEKTLFDEIKFPNGKIYEDLLTLPFIIDKCDYIEISTKKEYYYCIREDSITTSSFNKNDYKYFEYINEIRSFIGQKYKSVLPSFESRCISDSFIIINKIIKAKNISKKEKINKLKNISKMLKSKWNISEKNRYLTIQMKINIWLFKLNPSIYSSYFILKEQIKRIIK